MSEYKNEIDKMVWSHSRLTTYEHCKYEFYLNYLIDDDLYLCEGNYYAEVGSFVHEILAKIHNKELSIDDSPQYFADHFDDNVFYKTKQSTMDKNYEACANYFAEEDFAWLENCEIIGVEQEVNFEIKGYKFTGFIDLLVRDKTDGRLIVIDNKSSEYPFRLDGKVKAKAKASFETYKQQMYLYSYAIKDKYGEYPKLIMWNHFKDQKIATIPFNEKECDTAIEHILTTIKAIEKEEDYEPNLDFFYCTHLCNFRNSCEYARSTDWGLKE